MIRDLVELLDRRWEFLNAQQGYDFAAHVFPFFVDLRRDAITRAILDDLEVEDRESVSAAERAEVRATTLALALLDELERDHPDAFGSEDPENEDRRASVIRWRIDPSSPSSTAPEEYEIGVPINEGWEAHRLDTGIESLAHVSQKLSDRAATIQSIRSELEYARRARQLALRTGAGAALRRMTDRLDDLHPGPHVVFDQPRAMLRWARTNRGDLTWINGELFGREIPKLDGSRRHDNEAMLKKFRSDTRRVYEEVRRRLGAERSVRHVFERYRQRCQWYEAERLRKLVEDTTRKPEDTLAETLALYLFDHGLNPYVRLLVGPLQPDVLDATSPFSFYVEAKQYSDNKRRSYLRDGVSQVWDTLSQITGTSSEVREAFYVIYRLGGPRYALPDRLVHGRHTVFPLLVDIAPPAERGSRARETIVIDTDEWLPQAS